MNKYFKYIATILFALSICTTTAKAMGVSDSLLFMADDSCEGILGSPTEDGSTAYFLNEIFKIMKFAAPAMVVIFSIIEFAKSIASQDQDAMKKAIKNTGIRLVIGALIFMLPTILNFFFDLLGWYGTCGIG